MAVAPQTPSSQAPATTGKTKAKQRYLRRKKERRKQRKGTTAGAVNKPTGARNPSTVQIPSRATEDVDGDWEDDRNTAVSDNDVDMNSGEDQDNSVPRATVAPKGDTDVQVEMELDEEAMERKQRKLEKRKKREKRPKKRQKVDESVDEPLADDLADQVEKAGTSSPRSLTPDDAHIKDVEDIPTQEDVISQPGFLPVFPLPSQPAPPSKLALALQGLDTALSSAIVIPANSTHDISNSSSADEMGLTEKMRKRLLELDISELFAGSSTFPSFLGIKIYEYMQFKRHYCPSFSGHPMPKRCTCHTAHPEMRASLRLQDPVKHCHMPSLSLRYCAIS
jgi:ATP-dependent RNA helicase DDX51/DBP6